MISKKRRQQLVLNPQVSYRRNGISGNGFHVVLFDTMCLDGLHHMTAIVFKEEGNVAVFETLDISFAWRGDCYEKELRAAIERG